ncbi:alpha/beta fold hydrolase [Mycetocola sp.]|uniref:alpha/beta hydrolase n=1 Tax=Mycetocola sp. TaxID=1871042 RepID=UPI003989477B
MATLLAGITARTVATPRLAVNVLERENQGTGPVVVFLHGNVSSSLFWQPLMLDLPDSVRPIAIDLRGFGDSETAPVDATRGLRDFSDDVLGVLEALGIERAHFVGWSMGAGVVMQLMLDRADVVATATLTAPVSPYGFGGTTIDGTILSDAAGTGGGGANPDFVAALAAGDTTADSPTSPRQVFRATYVAAGYETGLEDLWVESMLSTKTGEDNYPGNSVPNDAWPGFGPGDRGVLNTMTADHFNVTAITELETKPPILWIRGDADAIVSDASFFDLNMLGSVGAIPGWPGASVAPPQPMVSQTRQVFERYGANGGAVREVLFDGCGHSPHLERPVEFREALLAHIGG